MSDDSAYTPTLSEVLAQAVNAKLLNMHTAMPATVEKFDAGSMMIDAQPSLKRKFSNGQVQPLPVVTNIPVLYPRSSKSIVYFPLEKGDSVLLVFCERSIDRWSSSGGLVDPGDSRKFDLSDAIAIPGPYSSAHVFDVADPTKMCVQFGDALVQIADDGKMKLGLKSNPQVELISLFSQTLDQLAQAQTANGPLLNAAQFAAFKLLIDQMKGS